MSRTARPYLLLVALWAVYFAPLLFHPTGVLYAYFSDFLTAHLPGKQFLAREWQRTGELPLWNPHHYCGLPFLHDVQVGLFYPPHLVAGRLPEPVIGPYLSWLTAAHVLLAGCGALAYARSQGLSAPAAVVAGVGVMFSGKWLAHLILGGQTVVAGLAWLPFVMLGVEAALRTGTWRPAVRAGLALGLVALSTHPQWALYGVVFAVLWTVPAAWARPGTVRVALARWAGRWAVAGGVAGLLAVVQILPVLEAAPLSTRASGVVSTLALEVGPGLGAALVGPAATTGSVSEFELRGLIGVLWVAAAVAAPALGGPAARFRTGVTVGLLVFAAGGAAAFDAVPGFNAFRLPIRMVLFVGWGASFLAAVTVDYLVRTGLDAAARDALKRGALVASAAAALAVAGWVVELRGGGGPLNPAWPAYLAALAIAVPVVVRFAGRPRVWVAVLCVDAVAACGYTVTMRDEADIYPETVALRFFAAHARPGGDRVCDWEAAPGAAGENLLFGTGAAAAMTYGFDVPRGLSGLDVRAYRQFLQLAATGDTTPVRAYTLFGFANLPNLPPTNRRLYDLLGARYVALPSGAPHPPDWVPVTDDPHPVTYDFALGTHPLSPCTVYENPAALPRAFVVPHAEAVPPGGEWDALLRTDFRTTVVLTAPGPVPPAGRAAFRPAAVTGYAPNRVAVRLDGDGGFLVLTDVGYPGWECRIDGEPAPVHRANGCFRAVPVPDGAREAVFTFVPRWYRIGWWVSAGTAAALVLLELVPLTLRLRAFKRPPVSP